MLTEPTKTHQNAIMVRAERGTPKDIAKRLKSKGLQRLRWWCQVCEKQCRDENGFRCHVASESHVRQMLIVGEHAGQQIRAYSATFQHDFLQLLRTSHGTKPVNANQFYQQYIANKTHMHMNATRWHTLSEFVKHLGREGICRVDDTDRGWVISWIDSSPEALARQQALKGRDRLEASDDLHRQRLVQKQIKKANQLKQEKQTSLSSTVSSGAVSVDSNTGIETGTGTGSAPADGKSPTIPAITTSLDTKDFSEDGSMKKPTADIKIAIPMSKISNINGKRPALNKLENPLKTRNKVNIKLS